MDLYAESILQTIREPLLVLDQELRITTANRSFFREFKVESAETIGRLIYELGNGQWNIPALRKLLNEVLPSRSAFNDYHVDHVFPGLGRRIMVLNARRLQQDADERELILLAIEDVTARREAEREVARQRAWFRTTLASIGDAVIATDAAARITFLNPTAERMTGWHEPEAMGKPLHEVFNIVNEETRKAVESPVTQSIRRGSIVGLANHTVLIARDGTERPIDDSAAPIRDDDGGIMGVVMVFHDITERRAAERRIESSEIRYRRLFEAAHDGVLILNERTHKIEEANSFLLHMLGYPREHFVGKELWEIGMFADKSANRAALQRLRDNGSIRYENLPLLDRNGRRHPVEIIANIYQEDHNPIIQCNIRDISECVGFEQERAALLANEQSLRMEAEAANRSKDMFLATLSHEVRTPLNAILGWATMLRSGKCTTGDLKEGMEVIERNCRAQAQIIDDVLDVSRIVSGKLRLNIRSCKLVDVINAALDVVRPAAEAKNIKFISSLDPSASEASCDKDRMQQVVWNLLSNAIKFAPRGTSVHITLSRAGSAARIQVKDEGQGISPEFMPHLFERFRQADSTSRRKLGGLGLGLSIVKHIMELHGGTVAAESAGLGRGAQFTIQLPVRAIHVNESDEDSKGAVAAPVSHQAPVSLAGLRVLIVDDEPDARRLLGRVLADAGARVTAAGTVAEAMKVVTDSPPEVLISDIAMPGEDGYDLIRQIRATGLTARDLPAIALTAFAHKDDQRRVMLAGYQIHVPKPVDPHDLIAIIASLSSRTGQ